MMNFLRKQMKWVMAIIVVAFLLSTFLMYEGRGTRRSPGRNADGSITDYEVAKINGRSLMRSELDRLLGEYLNNNSTRTAEGLDLSAIYQAVLDQAILEAQLAKEVEEKGIRVSEAEVDRAVKSDADRYYGGIREMFYQALANSGVKLEDYKRMRARDLAVAHLIEDAVGEVVISDDTAREFYDTVKDTYYTVAEGYMLHMADFKTSADAEYLRAKLEAGESWADIVSNDELASHDVISITTEPMFIPAVAFTIAPLSELASVDVGKPGPVFSISSSDYAVGLKTEHVASRVRTYDEVSADIKANLTAQEQNRRLNEFRTELRNKAQVVINDPELFARPAVSEDVMPAVEDVIPELTDAKPEAEEAKPESEDKVKVEAEAPSVVEEVKEDTDAPETVKEVEAEVETPAVVEEVKPEAETPAVEETVTIEETKPEAETPAVVEETVTVEEVKPETEAPAVVEEAVSEIETPAVVEEAVSAAEKANPAEKIAPESETPAVVEGIITEEIPAVVEKVIVSQEITSAE